MAKEIISKKSDLNNVTTNQKFSNKSVSEKNMANVKNWHSDRKVNEILMKNIEENIEFIGDEAQSYDLNNVNCNEKVEKFVQ